MVTTLIGVSGVTVGVAALITTLSVMNGFQSDIKKKIIDAQAHIIIYGSAGAADGGRLEAAMRKEPQIEAFSPFAVGQAILTFSDRSTGVMVKGLVPQGEFKINRLESSIRAGSWDALSPRATPGPSVPAIVLGEELAKNIGAWLDDEIVLVSPKSVATSIGIFPKMRKFRVAGLIHTGYYEFDNTMAYCAIKDAADFFNLAGGANGMGLKLRDIERSGPVAAALKKSLGFQYIVKTYADMNQTLFAALRLEKFVMSLVLALIILVAVFNIASNLLMMSVEKLRDIGILRSVGAGPSFVRRVFFWEGNLIALCGISLGVLLGVGLSLFIARYPVVELPSDIYYVSRVPVEIRFWDVVITALVSYALCMLSAVYPALRASKISPVDAIRYG